MTLSTLRTALIAGVVALGASTAANAVVTVFNAQDDGAPVGGPFTNSNAAEAAFLAAAGSKGSVATETFEAKAVGYYSPVAITNGTITYATPDLGVGLSGINNTTYGNVYGFNVTPGGEKWLGFPAFFNSAATFTFTTPTKSFGFYTTGIQSAYTTLLQVTQLDGTSATYTLPINSNGGVSFFGIVDTVAFTSVKISQTNTPGFADLWGIDDISYNTSLVPEPAAWALMIVGLGLVGAASRRRRSAVVTA
jgi:hypothetical protein